MSVLVKNVVGVKDQITSCKQRCKSSQLNRAHVNPLFYFFYLLLLCVNTSRVFDSDKSAYKAEVRALGMVPGQVGDRDNCG